MSFCGECGKKIPDGQIICPECFEKLHGKKTKRKEGKTTTKSKYLILGMNLIIALFAVFFAASFFIGNNDGKGKDPGTLEAWEAENYRQNKAESGPSTLTLTAPYAESLKANVMPETTAAVITNSEFIFPNSSSEYLSEEVLFLMSDEQLQLARNEIYARHGRMFSNPELMEYFMSKSWYIPIYEPAVFDAMGHSMMNEVEIYNLELIVDIEMSRR